VTDLTLWEQHVLSLLLGGRTAKQISIELERSFSAVKQDMRNIARKYGIDTKRYHISIRVLYLEATRRGLIPILDKAEVVQ
jgi:DNA-binding NarL/FixJ family response regulator